MDEPGDPPGNAHPNEHANNEHEDDPPALVIPEDVIDNEFDPPELEPNIEQEPIALEVEVVVPNRNYPAAAHLLPRLPAPRQAAAHLLPRFPAPRHIRLQNADRLFRRAQSALSLNVPGLDDTQSEDSDSDSESTTNQADVNMGASTSSNQNAEETRRLRRLSRMNFDRNLPTTHEYLGGDLEEVEAGQTIFDPGSIVSDVPLFPLPSIILMPGQTLPIQTLNLRAISMFRLIIEHRKIFATLHTEDVPDVHGDLFTQFADVGTLAQIIAFKEETEHETTTMCLKAVGRQRFKLMERRRTIDGSHIGKVLVLPEVSLEPALKMPAPPSLLKFSGSVKIPVNQRLKFLPSVFTPFPTFLYKQYDLKCVVDECINELCHWYDKGRVILMAENLTEFSFWIAANMPIDDKTKLELLAMDSGLARLMLELKLLKRGSEYCCRLCRHAICKKEDLFSMSLSGPMGAYVNNYGHLHETATFLNAKGVSVMTTPTAQNSWFPGYAWAILNCAHCMSHLGWKFTAQSRQLKPHKFWGITRASIIPRLSINNAIAMDNIPSRDLI